jgi:hypothetical protein
MRYMGGLCRADKGLEAVQIDLLTHGWMDNDTQHFLRLSGQRPAWARLPARSSGLADLHRHPECAFELRRDAVSCASRGIQ